MTSRLTTEPLFAAPAPDMSRAWRASGLSIPGSGRAKNEDSYLLVATDHAPALLAAVADGIGGHPRGDRASAAAIDELRTAATDPTDWRRDDEVRALVARCERRVYELAPAGASLRLPGTTLLAVHVAYLTATVLHVGDSRCYLWRGATLHKLTQDHAIGRHGLVNAIGGDRRPAFPDLLRVPLRLGDRLLLCTDGVTGCLADVELAECLQGELDPDACCRGIIKRVRARSGDDDATVVVVNVGSEAGLRRAGDRGARSSV